MSNDITVHEFEKLVAAYGAKNALWPQQYRSAMQNLVDSDGEAAAILARTEELDELLDAIGSAKLASPSEELHSRIMGDMEAALAGEIVPFPTPTAPSLRAVWTGATALAACFIGGIIMAPLLVDSVTGSADLLASLDIISDAFLPTDPL